MSGKRPARWPRTAATVLLGLLALTSIAELARRAADLPSLPVLADLQFDLTPRSQTWRLYDANPIRHATRPRPLPTQLRAIDTPLPWRDATTLDITGFMRATHTQALLVVQDGVVAVERYADGNDQHTRFASFSVAKSFVATLTGVALAQGKIGALDEPIGHYLGPDEIAPAYGGITIGQLLDMRSGIDVAEDYGGSLTSPVVRMYVSTDLGAFLARRHGLRFAPGTRFDYRSVDTLVLARVLARATGQSLSGYAQHTLWEPLGMEQDASWSVDSAAHGVEKAFCCLNTTARDFARLGLLYLADGRAPDGRQVISTAWARTPRQDVNPGDTLTYRDGWWLPPGNQADQDFSAIGVFGQYIYINSATRTVIVKLSDHGVEQDEVLTLLALRRLSHIVSGRP